MMKHAIAAFAVAFLTWSGAQAAPQATSLKIGPAVSHGNSADMLVEVKSKKRWKHGRYKHRGRHYRHGRYRGGYHRGRHYRRPPPGWARYSYRPYGWSRRGCLAFGPIWYCP